MSNYWPGEINRSRLLRRILQSFSEADLRTACFELGVDYDDLPPGGRSDKARDLIIYGEQSGRLADLLAVCQRMRPRIDWQGIARAAAGDESPFKGLQYFDEADADLFFGRERLTAELVSHLRRYHLLAVVGASGSGKSSLVRAGLVPALRSGRPLADGTKPPDGSAKWPVIILTPTAHPLETLALKLTEDSESVTAAETLMDDMASSPRSLRLYIRRLLDQRDQERLLLVIDQFEEVFTLCRDDEERQAFIDNLIGAASEEDDSPTTLIVTLRADFYHHYARHEALRTVLERYQRLIGQMTEDELRQAIIEPARLQGLRYEEGLVDLLLRDVVDEPGALPLLSHALLETWRRREGNVLTLAGYIDAGRVSGAIAKTADSVFDEQLTAEQQKIARNIFLRLTELGDGAQYSRRRTNRSELITQAVGETAVEQVLTKLADARLVTADRNTAEVTHEALIREWPRLCGWLEEDREGIQIQRRLTEATAAWESRDRDDSYLYHGLRLAEAEAWLEVHPNILSLNEQEFLDSSLAGQRRARRQRAGLGLALAGVVVAVIVFYVLIQRRTSEFIEQQSSEAAETSTAVAIAAAATAEAGNVRASAAELQATEVALQSAVGATAAAATAEAGNVRASEAELRALAQSLVTLARDIVAEDPLMAMRLAMESYLLIPEDEPAALETVANLMREIAASGRVLWLADDASAIWPAAEHYGTVDLTRPLFALYSDDGMVDLRFARDGSLLKMVTSENFPGPGRAVQVIVEEDGTTSNADQIEVRVGYDPEELSPNLIAVITGTVVGDAVSVSLYRLDDGSLVGELTSFENVDDGAFSHDTGATLAFLAYEDETAGLYYTTDLEPVKGLPGPVRQVYFGRPPNENLFVASYEGEPGEIRRVDDLSLLSSLSGELETVIPGELDRDVFVAVYTDTIGELRQWPSGDLIATLSGVVDEVSLAQEAADRFVVIYVDGTGELRRASDGSLVADLGDLEIGDRRVYPGFSPEPGSRFLEVVLRGEESSESLIWRAEDGEPIDNVTLDTYRDYGTPENSKTLLVYEDGSAELYIANLEPIRMVEFNGGSRYVELEASGAYIITGRNALVLSEDDEPPPLVYPLHRVANGSVVEEINFPRQGGRVIFSSDPQAEYFIVGVYEENIGTHYQLYNMVDASPAAGEVEIEKVFLKDDSFDAHEAIFFLDAEGQLRRLADGSTVEGLSGEVFDIFYSRDPDASYFVVFYRNNMPGELRRTADGALLVGNVNSVDFGSESDSPFGIDPLGEYFAVRFEDGRSEIWSLEGGRLAELGFGVPWGEYRFSTWSSGIMVGFFDPASQHLGVAYSDGSAYLIDLAWLRGMGGDPSNLSAEELIAIACSGPFNYAALESSLLEDYLDGRESMACSG